MAGCKNWNANVVVTHCSSGPKGDRVVCHGPVADPYPYPHMVYSTDRSNYPHLYLLLKKTYYGFGNSMMTWYDLDNLNYPRVWDQSDTQLCDVLVYRIGNNPLQRLPLRKPTK